MLKISAPLAALLLLGTAALAQTQTPGGHFVTNWDTDGDGIVSLQEATTRRDDIFTTFDADEDGKLSAPEYDQFDAARANDQAQMQKGKGHGKGHGKGMGEEDGMQRAFNDTDGDGLVARAEFMARVPDWFAMMDSNGDGGVTTDDFGPGN
jgi:hypothetical protein